MKKITPIVAIAATVLCCSVASADHRADSLVVTPVIGGFHYDGTQGIDANVIFGIKAGYNFTERLGLEGLFHKGRTKEFSTGQGKRLDVYNYRVEALYSLFPKSSFVPHIAIGYGGISSDAKNLAIGDKSAGAFSYGLGAKYFFQDNLALRADLRQLAIDRGPTVYNYEYTLGLSFYMGGEKPAPAVQAPKAAAPLPAPPAPTTSLTVSPATVAKGTPATLNWDSQNASSCDIQPGIGPVQARGSRSITPADTTSYTLTCSGDGGSSSSRANLDVTPAPVVIVDTDKDGIPDTVDKCPDTPAGVKVDKDGCPLDTDRDGVPDYLDRCPDTPVAARVDKDGCPLDSDRDGVADYLDKCPDTPAGDKVDERGCSLPVCQSMKLDIEFDTNKADIKAAYHDELKKVGDMLEKFPKATAAIEGHTDNVGTAKMNLKLSQRRADSVRKYIVEKFGIAADRITATGYGMTKPIATNKSAEGRKDNRRVEAILNCSN